jgi:hypothetical protein
MDFVLILLVIAIIIVGLYFRDFKSVVYFLGIIEIFFRLVHKLASLLGIEDFISFISKYIPSSLESIINTYSSGILNVILIWILVLLFIYFEWYLVIYWVKKKK